MKIIIVGAGKVGTAIARQLVSENHDITVIDSNSVSLSRTDGVLDLMSIQGNGASISVLISAGVRTADLVLAVTGQDEINLVCSLIAKKLGAKHTVARVRNPEYRQDADMLKKEIGLDLVINPDLAAAREIARLISFPAASSVEPFARGRLDMVGFHVTAEDSFCNVSLAGFARKTNAKVLICAAEHEGEYIIPDGSFVIHENDMLYAIGTRADLSKMLQGTSRSTNRIKYVSLLGGSRIANYLALELAKINVQTRIVEKDHDTAVKLAMKLPKAMVIEGDGTDTTLIEQENIFGADAFVALTDRDEDNLLTGMFARHSGVDKVIVKMTHPSYGEFIKQTGLESIISPKDIIANQITRYVRSLAYSEGGSVENLYKMFGGSLEALEFSTNASTSSVFGIPLKDMKLKKNMLIAVVVRYDQIIVPNGNTTIEDGDRVIVISQSNTLHSLNDIFQ